MAKKETFSQFISLIHEKEEGWICLDVKKDGRDQKFFLWERISEHNETFPMVKSEGILPCSAEKAYDLLLNAKLKTQKKWDPALLKCQVVRTISPTAHLMYYVYGAPFPVKSRDFSILRFSMEEDHRYVIWATSVMDEEIPVSSKYIRGEVSISGYFLEVLTENMCKITTVNNIDPKGWIPKFVVNLTKAKPLEKLIKFSTFVSSL